MDSNECGIQPTERRIYRPSWPYESWSDCTRTIDSNERTPEENDEQLQDVERSIEPDTDSLEEPDHWLDDLDDDVTDNCPIKTFLDLIESPDVSSTLEADVIKSDLMAIMENTLQALSSSYNIFKDSYIMPVGSMTERSKIYKIDEFDFAIMLPFLAKIDIFSLLLRKDSLMINDAIKEVLADIHNETYEDIVLNFSKYLKMLWSKEMLRHVTSKWEVQDTECYSDDVSVAGTIHLLNCSDNSTIDLDVCFWVPLNEDQLSSAMNDLQQKDYLLENCLDENGFVYAILPRDEGIEFSFNSIRFALSSLEWGKLHEFGPESNRLKCYRFCKCIVSKLVPKFQKRKNCSYCFESIVSSFCLKNIVFYLIEAYKQEKFWTNTQLPNRVVEVFAILSMCMKINFHRVSAYFAPYEIQINRTLRYSSEKNCVSTESCPEEGKECILPNIEDIKSKIEDDIARTALTDYDTFLREEEWSFAELICRLTEVLSVLRTEEASERAELVNNTGWNSYGLA